MKEKCMHLTLIISSFLWLLVATTTVQLTADLIENMDTSERPEDVQKEHKEEATALDNLSLEAEQILVEAMQAKFNQYESHTRKKKRKLVAALVNTRNKVATLEQASLTQLQDTEFLEKSGQWLDEQIARFTSDTVELTEIEDTTGKLKKLVDMVSLYTEDTRQMEEKDINTILQRIGNHLLKIYKVLLVTAREGIYVEPVILEEFQKAAHQYSATQKQCQADEKHCTGLREVLNSMDRMVEPLKRVIDELEREDIRNEMIGILEAE